MDCRNARENLTWYLDGELGPETLSDLGTHLDGCASCSELSARERKFNRELRRKAPLRPIPPDLSDRISGALLRDSRPVATALQPILRLRFALAAVIALVFLVGASSSLIRPDGVLHAWIAPGAPVTEMAGMIVCIGCEGQDPDHPVPHVHRNVLKSASGRFWTILETDRTRDLLASPSHWGQKVVLHGTFFERTGAVAVASLEYR